MALLLVPYSLPAQVTVDNLLSQMNRAFNPNGTQINSVQMTGTVQWIAGSTRESGDITFSLASDGTYSEIWRLATQSHSFNVSTDGSCSYTNASGRQRENVGTECHRALPWFAPWFGPQLVQGNAIIASLPNAANMTSDQTNLYFTLSLPASTTASAEANKRFQDLTKATVVGVGLDLTTNLPSSLTFVSLGNEPNAPSVSVKFSDYRTEAGYLFPHHIQRYVQRTLQADINISKITVE